MATPFYITTPIYYVNALPHLGTFYTTVVADALARFHRAVGDDTFFLTGLDEHGQKIERIARERGVEPQVYCDGIAAEFQKTWARMGVSNDDFIRTTSARHKKAVAEMWARMHASGDIYPAEYDGMYCVGCEDWKSEDDVVLDGDEKICPIHRRPVERVKEKNWFFRLSRYADYLLELYDRPGFIRPESRRNEVASFVRGGLKDISVSRMKKSVSWGIPVPGDDDHVIYVWIDALTNYLTVLGGPEAVAQPGPARTRWEAAHHLIAKDILRFHAVYWPAMLKSANLPPPAGIFCHGYLTVKGQKISKSMPATKVDPVMIAEDLGVEPLRYFVLREYSLGGDGDFTYEALLQRYESELGNDLGNLLNRTVSMARQYLGGTIAKSDGDLLGGDLHARATEVRNAWTSFQPSIALDLIWSCVRDTNAHIETRKPWVEFKQLGGAGTQDTLAYCCGWLRAIAKMIHPAMPETARNILRQLGRDSREAETWIADSSGLELFWPGNDRPMDAPQPLFPRLDPDRKAALIAKWMPAATPVSPAPTEPGKTTATPSAATADGIDKADFDRAELRAAKVVACERVPKTEKLLKLTLDIGTEQRTVISGIAAAYAPEALIGRTVIYVANLKPAKIRGVLSQGMILAAGDADVLALAALDRDVAPGTRIR